jgi:hypothetical protein
VEIINKHPGTIRILLFDKWRAWGLLPSCSKQSCFVVRSLSFWSDTLNISSKLQAMDSTNCVYFVRGMFILRWTFFGGFDSFDPAPAMMHNEQGPRVCPHSHPALDRAPGDRMEHAQYVCNVQQ